MSCYGAREGRGERHWGGVGLCACVAALARVRVQAWRQRLVHAVRLNDVGGWGCGLTRGGVGMRAPLLSVGIGPPRRTYIRKTAPLL